MSSLENIPRVSSFFNRATFRRVPLGSDLTVSFYNSRRLLVDIWYPAEDKAKVLSSPLLAFHLAGPFENALGSGAHHLGHHDRRSGRVCTNESRVPSRLTDHAPTPRDFNAGLRTLLLRLYVSTPTLHGCAPPLP